jgi:hypothetical protein
MPRPRRLPGKGIALSMAASGTIGAGIGVRTDAAPHSGSVRVAGSRGACAWPSPSRRYWLLAPVACRLPVVPVSERVLGQAL